MKRTSPHALQIWHDFIAKVYPGKMTAEQEMDAHKLRMAFFAGAITVVQRVQNAVPNFNEFAHEIKAEAVSLAGADNSRN